MAQLIVGQIFDIDPPDFEDAFPLVVLRPDIARRVAETNSVSSSKNLSTGDRLTSPESRSFPPCHRNAR